MIGGSTNPGTAFYVEEMNRLANKLGVRQEVIWAGELGPAEMSWCYQNCSVFVMTSRAEACPNTVLEAMAHGCLSVSTDLRPMPEFFDDTAVYYAAGDGDDLGRQLGRVLTLSVEQRSYRQTAATSRSKLFDWRITADATIAELARAAARRSGR